MSQPAFDFNRYPSTPGYKARETAIAAANSMKDKAPLIRERVLNLMRDLSGNGSGCTADEAAYILHLDILTVRPRFSELAQLGKVEDSGDRRPNASGKKAIVWRLIL